MTATLDRIRKIIVETLDTDPEKVTDNARLVDDLGADSLDTIELSMTVEQVFDIVIRDDETEALQTVADVVRLVDSKLAVAA